MPYTTLFDSQDGTRQARRARLQLYIKSEGARARVLKQAASPFGRIGPSPATHARPVSRPSVARRVGGGRVSGAGEQAGEQAGERAGERARAHGADDGQVEQRADQRHVAQEAEGNREEVAAG